MEPVIRNISSFGKPGDSSFRMIWLEDNPPTCTMTYSEIKPGKTSIHHIHPWEHEVYNISGAGTLVCDGKEYPVRDGDALFIPPDVDHYTLNNGGQGDIQRIEVNHLIAAQSGGARNDGGTGTGDPPVIRYYRDLNKETGSQILGAKDRPTYQEETNGEAGSLRAPGAHRGNGPPDTGSPAH